MVEVLAYEFQAYVNLAKQVYRGIRYTSMFKLVFEFVWSSDKHTENQEDEIYVFFVMYVEKKW